jgi:4'-phosphopantetheinyl transferase
LPTQGTAQPSPSAALTPVRWPPAPPLPRLAPGDVHVWRLALDLPAEDVASLESLLAPDERALGQRMRRERDRARFVVARGRLRAVLGRYSQQAPAALGFAYGAFGKPRLDPPGDAAGLAFNVSHAYGLALIAVTAGREVGVDLERVRGDVDASTIAAQFFSAPERAFIAERAAAGDVEAFFQLWTAREAFVKARGEGLSLPFDAFRVSVSADGQALTLEVPGHPDAAARWSLVPLAPAVGFRAALAVEGPVGRLDCWEWA